MAQSTTPGAPAGQPVTHAVAMAAQERRFSLNRVVVVVVLYLSAFWTLVPMYWVAVTSVKSMRDLAHIPPRLFPTDIRFDAWVTIIDRRILENIFNSLVVAGIATIICLLVAVPAAYAATRMRLPLKFVGIVVGLMGLVALLPPIASAIPLYDLASHLRLIDKKYTLIILYTVLNTAFAVWVLRGTFMDVPMDVEEAALMDGDTRFGAVRRILLPLIFPSLFSIAILLFIFNWNEYIIALFFVNSMDTMTLPIAIQGQIPQHELDWGVVSAAGTIAIFPVLIAAFTLQRFLVRGLTFGVASGQ
ncbi:MAG: carbohydrate ABC transporter permease [Caldilineaceae bacterium]|nr:carbohydrate ABC transporter permease [Caldilineaceae bacterium]MCY4093255.1 carbohydrate ABC transporter permease [Caldilineaceae bacterium]MCY4117203.1 carbohydrate ABC transporter permease [Caldilineaceae bacterium]MDE0070115.1 carbohydrate ABC transporter permease [Caldilineaceae bacterium]MDE0429512.1 carbohydrate ABC transporter permease [Caldilineaceae bacterium]